MTRHTLRCLLLVALGLSLSACDQHGSPRANCFNFRDSAPRSASDATRTNSTIGEMVTRRDTECDFVMLGAGS